MVVEQVGKGWYGLWSSQRHQHLKYHSPLQTNGRPSQTKECPMKSRVGVPGADLASRPEIAIGTQWKDTEKSGDGKLPWIRHGVLDNARTGSIR